MDKYNNIRFFCKQKNTKLYKAEDKNNDTVMIKEGNYLYNEYKIGCILNTVKSEHIVKTLDFFTDDTYDYIVTEFIYDAINLYKVFREDDMNLSKILCIHSIYALLDIQNKIEFTHYDFHADNIIIIRLEEKKTFTYTYKNITVSIDNEYMPIFIDFQYSYIEGIKDLWYFVPISGLYNGIIPSVFDNLYDIIVLISCYCNYYKYYINYNDIEKIIKIAGFNIYGYDNNNKILKGREITYWDHLYEKYEDDFPQSDYEKIYNILYSNGNFFWSDSSYDGNSIIKSIKSYTNYDNVNNSIVVCENIYDNIEKIAEQYKIDRSNTLTSLKKEIIKNRKIDVMDIINIFEKIPIN